MSSELGNDVAEGLGDTTDKEEPFTFPQTLSARSRTGNEHIFEIEGIYEEFGFYVGDRVMTPKGLAWVVGKYDGDLYFQVDGDAGASKWKFYNRKTIEDRFQLIYSSALKQKSMYNAPHLKTLVNQERFSDVTFVLDDGQLVHANKGILCARSEYFHALFKIGDVQHAEGVARDVRVESIDYDVFISIMEYLYTGYTDINSNNAAGIIVAADLFMLDELKERGGRVLVSHIESSTVLRLLKFAEQLRLESLQNKCTDFLRTNVRTDSILQSELKHFISRDNSDLILSILTSSPSVDAARPQDSTTEGPIARTASQTSARRARGSSRSRAHSAIHDPASTATNNNNNNNNTTRAADASTSLRRRISLATLHPISTQASHSSTSHPALPGEEQPGQEAEEGHGFSPQSLSERRRRSFLYEDVYPSIRRGAVSIPSLRAYTSRHSRRSPLLLGHPTGTIRVRPRVDTTLQHPNEETEQNGEADDNQAPGPPYQQRTAQGDDGVQSLSQERQQSQGRRSPTVLEGITLRSPFDTYSRQGILDMHTGGTTSTSRSRHTTSSSPLADTLVAIGVSDIPMSRRMRLRNSRSQASNDNCDDTNDSDTTSQHFGFSNPQHLRALSFPRISSTSSSQQIQSHSSLSTGQKRQRSEAASAARSSSTPSPHPQRTTTTTSTSSAVTSESSSNPNPRPTKRVATSSDMGGEEDSDDDELPLSSIRKGRPFASSSSSSAAGVQHGDDDQEEQQEEDSREGE